MTARERALKEFHKRWKKDAESDGEELPISQQLDNAWKLGWEARGSVVGELREWVKALPILSRKAAARGVREEVIAKIDDLMKEKGK